PMSSSGWWKPPCDACPGTCRATRPATGGRGGRPVDPPLNGAEPRTRRHGSPTCSPECPNVIAPIGTKKDDILAEKRREALPAEGIDQTEGAGRDGTGPGEAQGLAGRFDPFHDPYLADPYPFFAQARANSNGGSQRFSAALRTPVASS